MVTDDLLQQQCIETNENYLLTAERYYSRRFQRPEISFALTGRSAGLYRQQGRDKGVIRYNMDLLRQNADAFMKRTVPHEVAHAVAYQLHGIGIRPHGTEWQAIMGVFQADASRCHEYDTGAIRSRRYRYHTYRCACQVHQLTSIRHNRISRGQVYYCRNCKQPLEVEEVL